MKTKKLLAMGLATVLTIATCVPVLAANPSSGDTPVTYTEAETYEVTIPATVTYDKTTGSNIAGFALNTEQSNIVKGNTVKFKVSTPKVTMTGAADNSATFDLNLQLGENAIAGATVVAEFNQEGANSVTESLKLAPYTEKIQADSYTGTVTYAIECSAATTP